MLLGPISLLDCLVFVLCLTPQLLLQIGILGTLKCIAEVLPFLLLGLPFQLFTTDFLTPRSHRAPYHRTIPFFTALVIHCVRYAFAFLPAHIGAVFFSEPVALPFARWRMLRHGYWPFTSPTLTVPPLARSLRLKHPQEHFEERAVPGAISHDGGPSGGDGTKGLFVIRDPRRPPDIVIYYLHGGGFAMGSPWFYLEFLLAWVDLLVSSAEPRDERKDRQKKQGYSNPALFALDYTLVPHATFPTQVEQVVRGYRYMCDLAGDGVPVEVAGDSAGATLVLTLLLYIATQQEHGKGVANGVVRTSEGVAEGPLKKPDHATLISAWCRLISESNHNTASDYLNADSLHLYARQYLGSSDDHENSAYQALRHRARMYLGKPTSPTSMQHHSSYIDTALASPSDFRDADVWRKAIPDGGIHFIHGSEEVLAPEIRALVERLEGIKEGSTTVDEAPSQIHAWPVVDLFLAGSEGERLKGLRRLVGSMKEALRVWEKRRR
ncbi:MAG: hypothetical protein Q9162_006614 [Coniocarpon cinnabarinum]